MGYPKRQAYKHGIADFEELQIDFVAMSKHEGKMSTKPRGHGGGGRNTVAASKRNAIVSKFKSGGVVGIVDSPSAWRKASRLSRGDVDFLEWRVDCLGLDIPKAEFPWIVTARHPREGGNNAMSLVARREALTLLLPAAAILDIEVRSLESMQPVVAQAKASRVLVLASFHDFTKTPTSARLREVLRRAEDQGVDAVKIATRTVSPRDVARLLELFSIARLPLALMGMGPLGMASRILLASCGSVLNYGWLDAPNVPGQWSAMDLAENLRRCAGQDRD